MTYDVQQEMEVAKVQVLKDLENLYLEREQV